SGYYPYHGSVSYNSNPYSASSYSQNYSGTAYRPSTVPYINSVHSSPSPATEEYFWGGSSDDSYFWGKSHSQADRPSFDQFASTYTPDPFQQQQPKVQLASYTFPNFVTPAPRPEPL